MKNEFIGYYSPTGEEFEYLWEEALITFDANVLLNLYRYSEATRNELFKLLSRMKPRLWLPHQAALEYHRNRLSVIAGLEDAYEKIAESITDVENKLLGTLNGYSRHPLIQVDAITSKLKRTISDIKEELSDTKKNHPQLIRDDPVRDEITKIFDGKVGPAYSEEQLREIYAEGKRRYEKQIPPGFKDDSKEDDLRYGDLVVWKQLIDKAREAKKPLIFVTDDRKDDWWEKIKGKVVRPRPELIQEIWVSSEARFYMYQTVPFMEQAAKHLKRKVKQNAIDEIKEIRDHYEGLLSRPGKGLMIPFDLSKVDKQFLDLLSVPQQADLTNIPGRSDYEKWADTMDRLYWNHKLEKAEEMKEIVKKFRGGLLNMRDDAADDSPDKDE